MKPLQVAIITNTVPPYRVPLFKYWAEKADVSTYICETIPPGRQWHNATHKLAVPAEVLKTHRFGITGKGMLFASGLLSIVQRADVVVVGGTRRTAPITFRTAQLARRAGKGVVWWVGDFDNYYYRSFAKESLRWSLALRMYKMFRKTMCRYAHTVLAYGQRAGMEAAKLGMPQERIFRGTQVVYPGILAEGDADRGRFGISDKAVVGLYLGYLERRKGIEYLIQAFQQISHLHPEHWLIIAGAGGIEEELRKQTAALPRLLFAGYVQGRDKTALYKAADYFVSPTLYDPWAQVVMEAMSVGLPVITTSEEGACGELIDDGKTGFIVPPADQDALSKAMLRLIQDAYLRRQMARHATEKVQQYNLDYALTAFLSASREAFRLSQDVS